MGQLKNISVASGLALALSAAGCGQLSKQPTEREQTAAVGGLAGGASGAIIGSMAGSAVAGGLFGIPLGAVAGYYVGDQLASREDSMRSRMDEQEREIERLRRENERFRREEDRPATRSQLQKPQESRGMAQANIQSEENITNSQPAGDQQSRSDPGVAAPQSGSEAVSISGSELRQVQQKLNDLGFNAGHVDGMWGPNTQAAVKNFQQSKGLQATGTLDKKTANALGVENATKRK